MKSNLLRAAVVAACVTSGSLAPAAQPGDGGWLDRPLTNWNSPAATLVAAIPGAEPVSDIAKRCELQVRRGTAGERALSNAGWLPYLHVDRQIAERDVEITAGMVEADGMCRPLRFNVFVFAGGALAGTLSPVPMNSRTDGAIGAVRLAPDDTISAEFARYQNQDALCCPSGRVSVRYRIDRTAQHPVLVPVDIRNLR